MKLNQNKVLESRFFYFASAEVCQLGGREISFSKKKENK